MTEAVPQKIDFEKAEKYDKYRNTCKIIITIVSTVAAIYGISQFQNTVVEKTMSTVLIVVSLLSLYYYSRFKETFRKAEKTRRDGFLDNTFNTCLADISSSGYYDTDSIEHGVKKLMSNLHESCIFTCRISEKMFLKSEKELLVWFSLIVILALINTFGTLFVIAVIDVFLSKEVLDDYMELKRLHKETEVIQQECKRIAENAKIKKWEADNTMISEVLQVYLQYETALSYASIMLDTEIYQEINPAIMQEWNRIRVRYYQ